jgi:hypothetical protein
VWAPSWLAQCLIHHHIICDLFSSICGVKEAKVSIMAAHNSALVYHTLPRCLSVFLIGWNAVIVVFIVWPWAVIRAPKHSLPNACQYNNCLCLPLSVSHSAHLLIRKRNFWCWCGMALSHVCCHTGLPSHEYKHNEVLKAGVQWLLGHPVDGCRCHVQCSFHVIHCCITICRALCMKLTMI